MPIAGIYLNTLIMIKGGREGRRNRQRIIEWRKIFEITRMEQSVDICDQESWLIYFQYRCLPVRGILEKTTTNRGTLCRESLKLSFSYVFFYILRVQTYVKNLYFSSFFLLMMIRIEIKKSFQWYSNGNLQGWRSHNSLYR